MSRAETNRPLSALSLLACAGFLTAAAAPDANALRLRPANGRLVAFSTGDSKLYLMRTDGSHLAKLASNASAPSWSPAGTRMAFARTSATRQGITLLTLRGRRLRAITRHPSATYDDVPSFAPDGKWIAFMRQPSGGEAAIYLVATTGTRLRKLATGSDPAWSPDARRLVYSDQSRLFVIGANGRGKHALTSGSDPDVMPAWSPDGKRIAFVRKHEGNYDIWVVSADGKNERRLTTATGQDLNPSWSPDGRKLLFASQQSGGQFDIYLMNVDGSQQRRLTKLTGDEFDPAWQPRP
jgi:Tol biopolymer transport system component